MNYLVAKSFYSSKLRYTNEVYTFLQVVEPLAIEYFPEDVLSNEFRYLLQSLLFSKEFYEYQQKHSSDAEPLSGKLHELMVDKIRQNYDKLLDSEHRAYNINKICRVLSAIEGGKEGEQALLREICMKASEGMGDKMSFEEFIFTVNMVFPYILREQLALWNRVKF